MPLNGSDVASKPAGTTAVSNTTIESAKYNSVVDDLYSILNTVRSIAKGYTGATTGQGAINNFFAGGATVDDDEFLVADPSDNTKRVRLDAGSVTAGQTRVVTVGDADVTLRPQAWEMIGSPVAISSGSSSVAWTDLSAYRKLRISGFAVPTTDNVSFGIRTSTNNGSSYDSGASDYAGQYFQMASASTSALAGAASIYFLNYNANIGNAANEGIRFSMDVDEFNRSAYCYFGSEAFHIDPSGNVSRTVNGGRRLSATARDAIQFLAASGTLASGFVVLEGIRG